MVVEMIKDVNEIVRVGTIIGDDDCTTIARARAEVDQSLKKCSDKNHVRKSVSNDLYKLREKHKHDLPVKAIGYLQKCFTYALDQNRDDPVSLQQSLNAVVPHAFDDHGKCELYKVGWCQYLQSPVEYKHKSLPRGKGLCGEDLRKDLEALFSRYASNASKLSQLESSQANENFNNIVASKAPKTRHYCGSESLCYRVSAAVSQKNIGHTYMAKVSSRIEIVVADAMLASM